MIALLQPLPPAALIGFLVILGLVFGSFVTALSYRLPRGISIAKGRSACPACNTVLTARDLVPVFSWIAHRGACRACGSKISWRYPAIELATAGLFVTAALMIDDPVRLILVIAATPAMVALAVIDLECRRLPHVLIAWVAVTALGIRYTVDGDFLTAATAAATVFALAIILDTLGRRFLKQGLGMGDAKLMAAIAVALPPVSLMIALGAAGVLGVLMGLVWQRTESGPVFVPFGPALLLGFWAVLVTL
jgi:leader peptidase (prepilin peptidase)/N-methyltransferase